MALPPEQQQHSQPQPSRREILECQFSSWYPAFRNMKDEDPMGSDDDAEKKSHDDVDDKEGSGGGVKEARRRRKMKTQRRRRRKNATMKSMIIPFPPDFKEYLLSDGVILPEGATEVSSCLRSSDNGGAGGTNGNDDDDDWSSSSSSDHNDDGDDGDDSPPPRRYAFPALNSSIASSIQTLGGSAFPKCNWSSPKDASWMNGGSLKCRTAGDVYLLLKSSDFIVHDLVHSLDDARLEEVGEGEDKRSGGVIDADASAAGLEAGAKEEVEYHLVLRKWCNLHPSMEFRCFVHQHELVAISQRNHTQHFPHLNRDCTTIRSHIMDFFHSTIHRNFASGRVHRYVFDCYVDKHDDVWLLDFNVWGVRTDALLFTWDELVQLAEEGDGLGDGLGDGENINENDDGYDDVEELNSVRPEMRVVETELEVRHDPLASYRAPIDTVDLAACAGGGGGNLGDNASFQEFMAMCQRSS